MTTWQEKLADRMPEEQAREIDIFENRMELRRQGGVAGKLFAETRLRRFRRHQSPEQANDRATARGWTEEANLFVEACHACSAKLAAQSAPADIGDSTSSVVTLEI